MDYQPRCTHDVDGHPCGKPATLYKLKQWACQDHLEELLAQQEP